MYHDTGLIELVCFRESFVTKIEHSFIIFCSLNAADRTSMYHDIGPKKGISDQLKSTI